MARSALAAERLLLAMASLPLPTLDALRLALTFSGTATYVLTFDRRMREAALQSGLNVIDLGRRLSESDRRMVQRASVVVRRPGRRAGAPVVSQIPLSTSM